MQTLLGTLIYLGGKILPSNFAHSSVNPSVWGLWAYPLSNVYGQKLSGHDEDIPEGLKYLFDARPIYPLTDIQKVRKSLTKSTKETKYDVFIP